MACCRASCDRLHEAFRPVGSYRWSNWTRRSGTRSLPTEIVFAKQLRLDRGDEVTSMSRIKELGNRVREGEIYRHGRVSAPDQAARCRGAAAERQARKTLVATVVRVGVNKPAGGLIALPLNARGITHVIFDRSAAEDVN
jgi:hypothetical protein